MSLQRAESHVDGLTYMQLSMAVVNLKAQLDVSLVFETAWNNICLSILTPISKNSLFNLNQ